MTEETSNEAAQTELVATRLPGVGTAYLDQSMVPKVEAFIAEAARNGVNLHFNSAYRSPERQAALHNDPEAITPATNSLHSAGFAVDVNYSSLPPRDREIIRDAATAAGLRWGGDFNSPDPPHFYAVPSIDRHRAIDNATRQHLEMTAPAAAPATGEQDGQSTLQGGPTGIRALETLSPDDRTAYERIYSVVAVRGMGSLEAENVSSALLRSYKADPGMMRLDDVIIGRPHADGSANIFAVHYLQGSSGISLRQSVNEIDAAKIPSEQSIAQVQQMSAQQAALQDQGIQHENDTMSRGGRT